MSKDRIQGGVKQAKGTKETTGKTTGNPKQRTEGKANKLTSKAQKDAAKNS